MRGYGRMNRRMTSNRRVCAEVRRIVVSIVACVGMFGAAGAVQGACCLPEGACIEVPEALCTQLGGSHLEDVTCKSAVCEITGACCFDDLACQQLNEADCEASGGQPMLNLGCHDVVCPLRGACCLGGGACIISGFESCEAGGGTALGFGVGCETTSCLGACMAADGGCEIVSRALCELQANSFLGPDSECDPNGAPSIRRRFAFSRSPGVGPAFMLEPFDEHDGDRILERVIIEVDASMHALIELSNLSGGSIDTNVEMTQELALTIPNLVDPARAIDVQETITCSGGELPPGASCDFGGPITNHGNLRLVLDSVEAISAFRDAAVGISVDPHGLFSFNGSGFLLSQLVHVAEGELSVTYEFRIGGACCLPSGTCTFVNDLLCEDLGGSYQGHGSPCPTVVCEQPGACCMFINCSQLAEEECYASGGLYLGPLSECFACDQTICPSVGACCIADGRCQVMCSETCDTIGGAYQGDDVFCNDVECEETGACCLASGCEQASPESCDRLDGAYAGGGTSCGSVACAAVRCPEDLDGDQYVGFMELMQVLAGWGPCPEGCPADLDMTGRVDTLDITMVLSAWGACP